MASYQARQRDPLLDQNTQAMLEKRGRELLGVVLTVLALCFTLMLWTYSPEDPGWMIATQEPAQNALGRFGAAMSSTLIILIGRGAWAIPLILLAWGLRFILHRGSDRVLGRIVFAVIAVALAAAYGATLTAPQGWAHTFGLGGLFGDTVAGTVINILPGSDAFAIKALSILSFFGTIAMMLFVTGFDRAELRQILQTLIQGSIMIYAWLVQIGGKGAANAMDRASNAARTMAERRARTKADPAVYSPVPFNSAPASAGRSVVRREPELTEDYPEDEDFAPAPLGADQAWNAPASLRAEPRRTETAPLDLPKEKMGFLARMRRAVDPEPELIETRPPVAEDMSGPGDDRIKARISDAIRSRARGVAPALLASAQAAQAARRSEPPVVRPRRPQPLIAETRLSHLRPAPSVAEPEVTAAQAIEIASEMSEQEAIVADGYAVDDWQEPVAEDIHANSYTSADAQDWDEAEDWQPEDEDSWLQDEDIAPPAPRVAPVLDRRPIVQPAAVKPIQPSTRALWAAFTTGP